MTHKQQTAISVFIDELFKAKEFPPLESDIEKQVKKDLRERLDEFVRAHLIQRLDDKQIEELNNLLDINPSVEQMQQFWKDNIVDFKTVLTTIYFKFRNLYLK